MKFSVVANPIAGRGKGSRNGLLATELLKRKGHDVTFFQGASEQENRRFIEQGVGHCDALVVAGGDGMVHLAIQSLARSSTPLAVIPSGTGNDAARSLGLPLRSVDSAVDLIDEFHVQELDLGKVTGTAGERWFLQILSTGFDSVVNERANGYRWPKGRSKYNIAMLATLPRFEPITYTLVTEPDQTTTFEAMLVAIANGPSYGGGMLVCPDAVFDDGQFDVMVLSPVGRGRLLRLFPRVYKGTHIDHPKVNVTRTSELTISGVAVAYADGERIGPLPLRAEVVPGALKVLTAKTP